MCRVKHKGQVPQSSSKHPTFVQELLPSHFSSWRIILSGNATKSNQTQISKDILVQPSVRSSPPAHSLPHAEGGGSSAQPEDDLAAASQRSKNNSLFYTSTTHTALENKNNPVSESSWEQKESEEQQWLPATSPRVLPVLFHRAPSLEQNHQQLENPKVCIPQAPAPTRCKKLNHLFHFGCKNLRNKLQD